MTIYYEDTNKVVNGNAEIMADNSEMYVVAGITIGSKNGFDGVEGASGGSIQVYGAIIGLGGNAFFSSGDHNVFHVGVGGNISGSLTASVYGLGVSGAAGGNNVINDGTISGNTAIFLKGLGNVVENTGTISANTGYAIDLSNGSATISNSGTIASNGIAIHIGFDGDDTITVNNSGTIIGGPSHVGSSVPLAIQLGAGPGLITNTGHILGDIELSDTADTYYGGEGTVSGQIEGRDGDDIIVCGAGRDTIHGGNGADELEGGGGRDVFVYTHNHLAFGVESTGLSHDTIMDFDARKDLVEIDDSSGITDLDAKVTHGGLSDASFNADLVAALPKANLKADHAVLFAPDSGAYKGDTILVVDANGKAGYQANKDFVIVLNSPDNMDHFTLKDIVS